MTKQEITQAIRDQLAMEYGCAPDDLIRDGVSFLPLRDHPQRRPFPRGERHVEIVSMNGLGALVCAAERSLSAWQEKLAGLSVFDVMSFPLGNYVLFYLPDVDNFPALPLPNQYEYSWYDKKNMADLYAHPGFKNAVSYDPAHPRPDVIAIAAWKDGAAVGVAGASADCDRLWQVGIDVLPAHRGRGLATALVNRLTAAILDKEIVPYYGVGYCNIASHRTALRAGYLPTWAQAYGDNDKIIL